jgi:hypothetical protein
MVGVRNRPVDLSELGRVSTSLSVRLESGPVPDGVVPPGLLSFGQNLKPRNALARLARDLGLAPVDDFIYDDVGTVEAALGRMVWAPADDPGEGEIAIPIDESPVRGRRCLTSPEEQARILEELDANIPWFSPAEGLRTVRGLIRAIESSEELSERFYGAVWDLRDFECRLAYAERMGTRFHFSVSY